MKYNYLDSFSTALLIAIILAAIFSYSSLPDQIPVHYDIHGEVDRYGSKNTLWGIVGVSIFLYFFLGFISRLKSGFNYPGKVSEATKEDQLKLAQGFTQKMRVCVMILMTIVIASILKPAWFMPTGINVYVYVILGLIALLIIQYFLQFSNIESTSKD